MRDIALVIQILICFGPYVILQRVGEAGKSVFAAAHRRF